jgi:hypothetical protein
VNIVVLIVIDSPPTRLNLDPTLAANTQGIVAAYSDTARLAADGLAAVAYLVDMDTGEAAHLLHELAGVWQGNATVTGYLVGDRLVVTE